MKAKVNIIGIGAQKCASTWAYEMLREHPSVAVSDEKEVNFFSYYYDKGYHWYEQQFQDHNADNFAEISPSYFCDLNAPARVKAYNPEAKIVLTLRHPVQRALSNHRHEVRLAQASPLDPSFEFGLSNNPMYIEQSLYAKHLNNWLMHFDHDKILVLLMDDIKDDADAAVGKLYQFLGLSSDYKPASINKAYNRSFANKNQKLAGIKDTLYLASRRAPLKWFWLAADKMGLKSIYRRYNQVESDTVIPKPAPQTIEDLQNIFTQDIDELEKLIGRNLDAWKT